MFWKRSPPGMNTCVPESRCSVIPLRKKSMPSVVMNDGTRRNVVIDAARQPDERREDERGDHPDPDRAGRAASSDETTYTIAGASA